MKFLLALLMFSPPDCCLAAEASLEVKLDKMMERLTRMEADMEAVTEAMETKDQRIRYLEEAVAIGEEQICELENQVRNQPFAFQCGWRAGQWSEDSSIITYDSLTFSSMFNVDGGLDISTGVFTAGYSGVWSVSYSIRSTQYSGERNEAWLYLNDERMKESQHWTGYYGSEGDVLLMGSRTLFLRLETGDTITLRTGIVDNGLFYITLCFQLAQPD